MKQLLTILILFIAITSNGQLIRQNQIDLLDTVSTEIIYTNWVEFITNNSGSGYVETVNSESPTTGNVDIDLQDVTDISATTTNDLTISKVTPTLKIVSTSASGQSNVYLYNNITSFLGGISAVTGEIVLKSPSAGAILVKTLNATHYFKTDANGMYLYDIPAKSTETNVVYVNPTTGLLSYGAEGSGTIGTVTSIGITGSDFGITNSPITTSGDIGLSIASGVVGSTELASTTVTPGSYTATDLTVDADGRITSASNGTVGSTDYISNLVFSGNTLTSTGVGSAFNSTVSDIAGTGAANVFTQDQIINTASPIITFKPTSSSPTTGGLQWKNIADDATVGWLYTTENSQMQLINYDDEGMKLTTASTKTFEMTSDGHYFGDLDEVTQTDVLGFNDATGEITFQPAGGSGDVTSIIGSTGIDASSATGDVTLTFDGNELPENASTLLGTDEILIVDGATSEKEQIQDFDLGIFGSGSATNTHVPIADGSGGVAWGTQSSGSVSFGTTTQVPYMNSGGTDFIYSSNMSFDGTEFTASDLRADDDLQVDDRVLVGIPTSIQLNGSVGNITAENITISDYVQTSYLKLLERSSDPGSPGAGSSFLWQSDGTGSGDDGDIMITINNGSSTKTITLIDFSTF